ncbi:MAG: SCO family protein [Flavobacteriales bacterium]|nr:SCO family protein [Flavobacteriales bacterium]
MRIESKFGVLVCLFWALFLACENEPEDIPLPYFNSAEFTPEWIVKEDASYKTIHTIKDFSFTNQHGIQITNDALQGKVSIANFFFTACSGICPKMMGNMIRIQENFGNHDDVAILSHSVTPKEDSVAQLKQYANHMGIHSNNWHLLTGSKAKIYDIARVSYFADEGFGKSVTSEEDFLHTENVLLIDKEGHIRGVYNGTLPVEINRLIDDTHFLLKND